MRRNRFGVALSVLTVGALLVSGCESNDTRAWGSGATPSGQVNCGAKKALKASGSTAQANEIVCWKYPDPQIGAAVKAFLQSIIGDGQNGLAANGYIPVPASFESRLAESINAIS